MRPIPKIEMPAADLLRYAPIDEGFVDIESYTDGRILTEMKYLAAGRPGALSRAYARKGVADRLLRAASLLPHGYALKIYDAWRPYTVQKSLYDEYFALLKREKPSLSDEELHKEARTFVSFPDPSLPFSFVHSSGGAVDLTVVDEGGVELDMGCPFDDFTPRASVFALEDEETAARDNRRLLYTVMTEAGFTSFPSEWWHYDYGDRFWAATTGEAVLYSSVYETEKLPLYAIPF